MNKSGIALLMMVLMGSCAQKERPDLKPVNTGKEGTSLPAFNLLIADDKIKYINSEDIMNGKTTLMFYFSPVCPHCRIQTRRLINDMDKFKDVQVVFLTIANYKSTKSFYNRYDLGEYKNVILGIDTGFVFPRYFNTNKVPFFAIYQSDKKLKQAFKGEVSIKQLYKETHSIKDIAYKSERTKTITPQN